MVSDRKHIPRLLLFVLRRDLSVATGIGKDGSTVTGAELYDQILTMLIAGHDSFSRWVMSAGNGVHLTIILVGRGKVQKGPGSGDAFRACVDLAPSTDDIGQEEIVAANAIVIQNGAGGLCIGDGRANGCVQVDGEGLVIFFAGLAQNFNRDGFVDIPRRKGDCASRLNVICAMQGRAIRHIV